VHFIGPPEQNARRAAPLLCVLLLACGNTLKAQSVSLPILIYHHIGDPPSGATGKHHDLYCPRRVFGEHLQLLSDLGYSTVTFRDLRAFLEEQGKLPPNPILLSFDDGDAEHWDAFQDLKSSRMRAVFFIVLESLGEPGHLTREQVRAMDAEGMEIGSHSITHRDLRFLTQDVLVREIRDSKDALEGLLGRPVVSFCYPGGAYDARVKEALGASDYWFARTSDAGVSEIVGRDFGLKGILVRNSTTTKVLGNKLRRLAP
jgi:peptidoglycan/xylan/chitin deacetylase (PgdA/CDA1 family)